MQLILKNKLSIQVESHLEHRGFELGIRTHRKYIYDAISNCKEKLKDEEEIINSVIELAENLSK